MNKFAVMLIVGLMFAASSQPQESRRDACIQKCIAERVDLELQRQEIVSLEREAARAIQLNNGTFFRRVYSDDYAGTLTHGQPVDKGQWIGIIESPAVKYESFLATDIKVRIFQDTAIATCLWSTRAVVKKQYISSQIRAIHVYLNSPRGWKAVSGQTTNLPPNVEQPI